MQLVLPMAGLGSRFSKAGFTTPKPLITVSGKPMVVRAVEDLPPVQSKTFVVHPEHVANHQIDSVLRSYFPNARILIAPGLTAGQACTVRLAATDLEPNEEVLVAACDATHVYRREKFEALRADPTVSAMIWGYQREPQTLINPNAYGWVRTASNQLDVLDISCKRPASSQPIHDFVISGFFWFRSVSLMTQAIDAMILADHRVNGEFYLDVVPEYLLRQGHRVVVFGVDKHIGWGTPEELHGYQCWERYFAAAG